MTRICCGECGCVPAAWERVYCWSGGSGAQLVCEDCFDSLFFGLTRSERAALLGSEETTVADLLLAGRDRLCRDPPDAAAGKGIRERAHGVFYSQK